MTPWLRPREAFVTENLTALIEGARRGDKDAYAALFQATYDDLRRLAHARLNRKTSRSTLDTTAVVHESFIRFSEAGKIRLEDRAHFLRYAGCVMRSVIVDFVRRGQAERRGAAAVHVTLNTQNLGAAAAPDSGEAEILRVHEALEQIAQANPRLVQVVELRYFGGLTETEIAQALGVTERTVRRDWDKARLMLACELNEIPVGSER